MNNDTEIDLRSDTCSKPTEAMRTAMAAAELGDDVYDDDPATIELEKRVAAELGKEAAVFVPTGTMANQIALRLHAGNGEAAIVDAASHIADWEGGGPAALSGISLLRVKTAGGIMNPGEIKAQIYRPHRFSPQRMHPVARVLCLENTHNSSGGTVWPQAALDAAAAAGREAGLALHLDGARLWNASVASGVGADRIAASFDTVCVCFSKGLGAPAGSALAGRAGDVERARRTKHLFGGGMRQTGILAAAALHGLDHHRERLAEDHANARAFAERLAEIDAVQIDLARVQTNIVRFRFASPVAEAVSEQCAARGLKILAGSPYAMRAVFHLNVRRDHMLRAVETIRDAVSAVA